VDETPLTRRELLAGATFAALAAMATGRSSAQPRELVANTYGGGWETAHRRFVAEPVERKTGARVTLVSMLAAELVARTKAAAGGRPPVDVALVDDGPFLLAVREGVFQRMPMARIPNAARVYPKYRPKEPYGVPVSASVIGVAWNARKLKTPPTSWADLWKPEYRGRIGLNTPASTLGTVSLVSLARLRGGDEGNIEPGFAAVKSLLPGVASIAASPAGLQTLLERGEVDVAPMWHTNTMILKAKGTGIEFALPKEGPIAGLAWWALTNGANVDLAVEYVNQGLDPDTQKALAGPPNFFGPVVQGVGVGPELKGIVPATPAEFEALTTLDWERINPQRTEWINRWNREIKL
jgi:putative spermidine/putrescine transport system substrate-binding protein